jgi:hypothetical protein
MKTINISQIAFYFLTFIGLNSFAATFQVQPTFSSPSCGDRVDGKIVLSISGGKAPYKIQWENGSNELERNGLNFGKYLYQVADSRGERLNGEIELKPNEPIAVTFGVGSYVNINGTNAQCNFLINGGDPIEGIGYIVKLDGQLIHEKSSLSGPYKHILEIEDAAGCTLKFPVLSITEKKNEFCSENYDEDLKYQGLPLIFILVPEIKSKPLVTMENNLTILD